VPTLAAERARKRARAAPWGGPGEGRAWWATRLGEVGRAGELGHVIQPASGSARGRGWGRSRQVGRAPAGPRQGGPRRGGKRREEAGRGWAERRGRGFSFLISSYFLFFLLLKFKLLIE
jgi:hypothetical protein